MAWGSVQQESPHSLRVAARVAGSLPLVLDKSVTHRPSDLGDISSSFYRCRNKGLGQGVKPVPGGKIPSL